jgi:hypothetical protein
VSPEESRQVNPAVKAATEDAYSAEEQLPDTIQASPIDKAFERDQLRQANHHIYSGISQRISQTGLKWLHTFDDLSPVRCRVIRRVAEGLSSPIKQRSCQHIFQPREQSRRQSQRSARHLRFWSSVVSRCWRCKLW